ncbi:NADPH-dependent FMN reductase [Neolewinella antarctica]|uniref:NAD(P)H-dependent FMN reductase n=1 Tax=Neolewinella antarctica TaxID=442734 RepID=A0ABX0XAQ6_9BACT|nr:NAD(P)H-dependent oxidoreductase [Neolewinella antarctica]NJC26356.1 NAD(P)H-dependent FMN reductase [Neolewinella antarctica]
MITVVSGTNRSGSLTLKYAAHFTDIIKQSGQDAQLLDLALLNAEDFTQEMYDPSQMSSTFLSLQQRFVIEADKLVFFVPEYNGSYPGVLKLFIDAVSVYETAKNFGGKKIALIGIASGRAGNLRGMDHLADTLAHMGAWVLPNRLPISAAHEYLPEETITHQATLDNLKKHAQQLIAA